MPNYDWPLAEVPQNGLGWWGNHLHSDSVGIDGVELTIIPKYLNITSVTLYSRLLCLN